MEFPGGLGVKDLVLSLLWLELIPGLGNLSCHSCDQKKFKKKKKTLNTLFSPREGISKKRRETGVSLHAEGKKHPNTTPTPRLYTSFLKPAMPSKVKCEPER